MIDDPLAWKKTYPYCHLYPLPTSWYVFVHFSALLRLDVRVIITTEKSPPARHASFFFLFSYLMYDISYFSISFFYYFTIHVSIFSYFCTPPILFLFPLTLSTIPVRGVHQFASITHRDLHTLAPLPPTPTGHYFNPFSVSLEREFSSSRSLVILSLSPSLFFHPFLPSHFSLSPLRTLCRRQVRAPLRNANSSVTCTPQFRLYPSLYHVDRCRRTHTHSHVGHRYIYILICICV